MIFKKKYKRSKWFEGLLFAEEMVQQGFSHDLIGSNPMWFTKVDDNGIETRYSVSYSSDGRKDGVEDYIEYKQDVLEKLK